MRHETQGSIVTMETKMASQYEKIVDMIRKLDLNDDGIVMNHKIKSIEQDFCNIVIDENMLSESMEYINKQVLHETDASMKFALLFASRNFDSLAMNDIKVRNKMMNILQDNFVKSEEYRKEDKQMLYNSITLLGEYYHRIRLANGTPISVLGESLLEQLTRELNFEADGVAKPIETKLAKLILSQITLNGSLMRSRHKEELDTLLYLIRRNLIEVPNLQSNVKGLLLMTLDLYYNNFSSLGENLENMYMKYLMDEGDPEPEVLNKSSTPTSAINTPLESSPPEELLEPSPDICDVMKFKWSEEVCNNYNDNLPIENGCSSPQTPESAIDGRPPSNADHDRTSPRRKSSISNSNYNYDDDRHSVRSEGGSIRLYSVSDRLKYAQRGNNPNNWDRNYHSYDRNRRSSSRNSNHQYENNRNYHGKNNNRNYNTYRPPPRFANNNSNSTDLWRNGSEHNYGSRQNLNSNSRSSSQTRERYPRNPQQRNNYENYNGRNNSPSSSKNSFNNQKHKNNFNRNNNYNNNQNRQQTRNFGHNRNNRYGSHNSLTSDTGTWETRGRRRNSRGKSQDFYSHDDTRSLHDQNEDDWNPPSENSEIVKNARNTTNYMKYLSKK